MSNDKSVQLAAIIAKHENELLEGWFAGMMSRMIRRDKNAESELRQQGAAFLNVLGDALRSGAGADIEASAWDETRRMLAEISQARVRQGFSSIETAHFIFALKEPLFGYLRDELASADRNCGRR